MDDWENYQPETFLDVRFAKLALVCTRPKCAVPYQRKGGTPMLRDLVIELPERCLPEEAVILRAKHVATHVEEVRPDGPVDK